MGDSVDLTKLPPKYNFRETPRWVTESYIGVEEDILNWLWSFYFWSEWDGREANLNDTYSKSRANAEAKMKSMKHTGELKGAVGRSFYIQLYEAQKHGWYRMMEIEDVNELLSYMLDEATEKDPDGGARYEIKFLIDTLLPLIERAGVPKELALAIPQNITKARAAVSTVRRIIDQDGPEMSERLATELRDIADPQVSVANYRKRSAERMGKSHVDLPPPARAEIYLLPGSEMIVIESDRIHTTAIERATKGIVDGYDIRDGAVLIKMLSQRILRGDEMKYHRIVVNDGDPTVVVHQQGAYLPMPEEMQRLQVIEIARSRFLIGQMDRDKIIKVPVYVMSGHLEPSQVDEYVQGIFSFSSPAPQHVAQVAFDKYYLLNPDVLYMLDGRAVYLSMEYWPQGQVFGVFLTIC